MDLDLPASSLQALNLSISRFQLLCRYGGEPSSMARAAAGILPGLRSIGGFDQEVDLEVALRGQRWDAVEVGKRAAAAPSSARRRFTPTFRCGDQAGLVLLSRGGRWTEWEERGQRAAASEALRAVLVLWEGGKRPSICRFREHQPPHPVTYAAVAPSAPHREHLHRVLTGLLVKEVA